MASPVSILDYRQPVEFRIGDVAARSWQVLTRNILTFSILTGAALLPQLVLSTGMLPIAPEAVSGLSFLSQVVLSALAQAVVVYAAFEELRGRRPATGESFSRGFTRFLPAILVSGVSGFVVVLGLICLVVPGLIAAAAYSVAVPVCVVEGAPTRASMRRSSELTSGYKGKIIGVYAAYFSVLGIVSALIDNVISAPIPAAFLGWFWTVFTTAFSAVFAAILYHDLRAVKEGIGIDEIAAVFD